MDNAGDVDEELRSMADDLVSPVRFGTKEGDGRCPTSSEHMEGKENVCTSSENGSSMWVFSKGTAKTWKSRKLGGCDLRKSLAWNKAFFTEEGVLDPFELDLLNGPAIKSGGRCLSVIKDGEASPVMNSVVCSGGRSVLHALDEELRTKVPTTRQSGILKTGGSFSKSKLSTREDQSLLLAQQSVRLAKGICRSVSRPKAAHSYAQKRLGNLNTTNPASTSPNSTKAKLDNSSVSVASGNVVSATKRGNSSQNVPPVSVDAKIHSSSSVNKKHNIYCPTSSVKFSNCKSRKIMVNETSAMPIATNLKASHTGTCVRESKMPPKPSLLTNSNISDSHVASGKIAFSHSQNSQVFGGPPARAKPSGLRMPLPSRGFFCQAKVSPTFQSQRNTQQCNISESTTQSLKPCNNLKRRSELRPLYDLHCRQPPISSTVMTGHTTGASVFDTTLSTENCSNTYLRTLDERSEITPNRKQRKNEGMIGKDSYKSESCDHQPNGQNLPTDCLMVDVSTDKKIEEETFEKLDKIKEAPYLNSSMLLKDKNTIFTDCGFSEEDMEVNAVQNVDSTTLSASEYSGDSLSHIHLKPEMCSPKLQTWGSGDGKLSVCKYKEAPADSCTTTTIGNSLAGNSDLASGLRFGNADDYIGPSNVLIEESSLRPSRIGGETNICSELCCSSIENLYSDMKNAIVANDDNAARPEKEGIIDNSKQDSVPVKYKLKAVPFSEEWVAALEAFGEDILEQKTGVVQNSPPEKVLPNPSPWSPVKKNAEVGPYDCTKYTKTS